MSGCRKVWEVHDKDVDLGSALVRAETAGKAKYEALMWEDFCLAGCGYTDLRAGDSDEDITRRYGYGPGIIQALKDTIRRESIWDDEGGPEF